MTFGLNVVDDIFPLEYSAFRFSEFNAYLYEFPDAKVYSHGSALKALKESRDFDEILRRYRLKHARIGSRVLKLVHSSQFDGSLVYCVFVDNMYRFLPIAEERNIPFVFTLYPGGGLFLGNKECEKKLRRIFGSRQFRAVIVTQTIVRDYLVDRGFCSADKIEFIFGVVTSQPKKPVYSVEKTVFGRDKATFDICFAAHKYTRNGVDKGFDIFVATARILARKSDRFRFHVVGGFTADDVGDSDLRTRMTFHGVLSRDRFGWLFDRMDAILSPNPEYATQLGEFNGFPTGSCVEAGLRGVPVFCTDPHRLNTVFEHGKDIVIIDRQPASIAAEVESYFAAPERLLELSSATGRSFRRIFGYEAQIGRRIDFLRLHLAGASPKAAHPRLRVRENRRV